MKLKLFAMALASVGTLWAGGEGEGLVESDATSPWHFRIGPVMAPRVRAKVNAPMAVMPSVPSPQSGFGKDTTADPSAGHVKRQYVDGQVSPDAGTDDPNSLVSGLTWNWGANDVGAQYSGGQMEFRTDMTRWNESVSASSYRSGFGSECDRDTLLGVEAMGGWTFFENRNFDATVDGGFRYYGSGDLSATTRSGMSATTTRNEYRYVDRYDASGWSSVPSGAYSGTPGGPGRIIGATPNRQEELMGSYESTQSYSSFNNAKLDYTIWDLRLGPTAGWKAAEWLTVRGGAYGLLGLTDARLSSDVMGSTGVYGTQTSKCDPLFGLGFALSAEVHLTDNFFFLGGAEYDWWSDQVSLSAGGADAHLQLSDFTVSLAVGVDF